MIPPLNLTNQQFAQGQQAAQQVKAGQVPTGPAALQQQGARAGAVAQAAQTQQAVQQAGKEVFQAEQQQARKDIARQEERTMSQAVAQKAFNDQQRKLQKFARELDNNMLEERRDFSRQKRDQGFNNERQLAEWSIINARNDIEANNRIREMQQASQDKIRTLEIIQKRVMIEEQQLSTQKMNAKTRALQKKLANMKAKMEEKLRKEREKARKKGGMMQMMTGTVMMAGGVALAATAGWTGVGAVAGASLASQGAGQFASGYEAQK